MTDEEKEDIVTELECKLSDFLENLVERLKTEAEIPEREIKPLLIRFLELQLKDLKAHQKRLASAPKKPKKSKK